MRHIHRLCWSVVAATAAVVCLWACCQAYARGATRADSVPVHGFVADAKFMALRDAFRSTLMNHEGTGTKPRGSGGGGASFAVYHRGRLVVDVWGGEAESPAPLAPCTMGAVSRAPLDAHWVSEAPQRCRAGGNRQSAGTTSEWQATTASYMFSGTKGLAAVAIAVLVDQGHLRYSDPVAKYWPDFGRAGKRNVTVGMVLAHSAGLSALDRYQRQSPLQWATDSGEHMARMHPVWEPGAQVGYAPWAVGTVVAELVPRVDPQHRPVDVFFREEVAQRLGVADQLALGRLQPAAGMQVAKFRFAGLSTWLPAPWRIPHAVTHATIPSSLSWRAFANPRGNPLHFNSPRWQGAMLPNTNGFGTARAVAKVYAAMVQSVVDDPSTRGDVTPLVSEATVRRAGLSTSIAGPDQVMMVDTAFGMGFVRCSEYFPMDMTPARRRSGTTWLDDGCQGVFGHPGFGGAVAWADARTGLAVAYLPSVLDPAASARSVRFATLRGAFEKIVENHLQ